MEVSTHSHTSNFELRTLKAYKDTTKERVLWGTLNKNVIEKNNKLD